jgi:hypothetical protein
LNDGATRAYVEGPRCLVGGAHPNGSRGGVVLVDETEGQQFPAKVWWALSSKRSLWGPDALCRRQL